MDVDDAQPDFRKFLRDELKRRHQRNPSYSLRAFARDLKLSASRLCEVLNGHGTLSRMSAVKLAETMGLNDAEAAYFVDLVDQENPRSATRRDEAAARVASFRRSGRELAAGSHLLPFEAKRLPDVTACVDRFVKTFADEFGVSVPEEADHLAVQLVFLRKLDFE